MEIFLYLAFLAAFVIASLKNIRYGVFLVVASLPLYVVRFNIFFIPTTLLEMMIFSVFAVWLYRSYRDEVYLFKHRIAGDSIGKKIQRYPFDIELVLLLIISFAAILVGGHSKEAFGIWKAYFFDPALFYIVLVNVLLSCPEKATDNPTEDQRMLPRSGIPDRTRQILGNIINLVILPFSLSAVYVSAIAIFQKLTGLFIPNEFWADEATRRVTSLFGYPNAVGLYLGPLILILAGLVFDTLKNNKEISSKKKMTTLYLILAIGLSFISVYFARSEGALIGVAAAVFFFCLLANKRTRIIVLAISIIAAFGAMFSPGLKAYAWEKITLNDFSGNVRKLQWAETFEMLKDGRTILGAGLANYQDAIIAYHQEGFFFNKDRDPDFRRKIVIFDERYKNKYWQPLEIYLYPHNILLNFWSELGLAGMCLFVWVFIKFFYLGLKNLDLFRNYKLEIRNSYVDQYRYILLGFICSFFAVVVHGLVDVPYFKNDLAVMFWIFIACLGMLDAAGKLKKPSPDKDGF